MTSPSNPATVRHVATLQVLARVAAAMFGGWAFTWGLVSLGITGLVALGQPYDEARTALMLLAFLVFLAAFLWAFAAHSLLRVWVTLVGGAALTTGAAWALQRTLV